MNVTIAICDDRALDRDYMRALAEDWASRAGVAARILEFSSAEAFWFHYAADKTADILLLDIEMGPMNGVTLAKKLRADNDALQIVFVTGFPDYIAEGYDVSALHYLMKPVREEKLREVLDRAAKAARRPERAVLLPMEGETARVALKEITYIEVLDHTLSVHTAQSQYAAKLSMKDLENQLTGEFARCHRAYIVNLRYVRRIARAEVELDTGEALPLSRRLYGDVNRAMLRYVKGESGE